MVVVRGRLSPEAGAALRAAIIGRKTRAISAPLRRALARRDGGCQFPGCGLRLCDAHHLQHWADGGKTKLDNLVQLCRRHHRAVHEEGFRVQRVATGELRFFRPDGRTLPPVPDSPPIRSDALLDLADYLKERGVEVDVDAGLPGWDGAPFDLVWAVDCLRAVGVRPNPTSAS
jgi:hypothetical protein